MRKGFALIGAVVIFAFGLILHYSYIISDGTVWSILISSINNSAWEILKPFAIAYIMWIIIELSVLRPSLLHFICTKILMLYLLAFMVIIYSLCVRYFVNSFLSEIIFMSGILIIIATVQIISYKIYASKIKLEIFCIPILIAMLLFFIMILFFSLYPPHFIVFRDFESGLYGLMREFVICSA